VVEGYGGIAPLASQRWNDFTSAKQFYQAISWQMKFYFAS
jgi:hypothetical protein